MQMTSIFINVFDNQGMALRKTEEEKMLPWLAAITDSLEVLHKHDENTKGSMNYIMEKANIQYKSVNFMRGRSIQNAIVILDESQNLTASQL